MIRRYLNTCYNTVTIHIHQTGDNLLALAAFSRILIFEPENTEDYVIEDLDKSFQITLS